MLLNTMLLRVTLILLQLLKKTLATLNPDNVRISFKFRNFADFGDQDTLVEKAFSTKHKIEGE